MNVAVDVVSKGRSSEPRVGKKRTFFSIFLIPLYCLPMTERSFSKEMYGVSVPRRMH